MAPTVISSASLEMITLDITLVVKMEKKSVFQDGRRTRIRLAMITASNPSVPLVVTRRTATAKPLESAYVEMVGRGHNVTSVSSTQAVFTEHAAKLMVVSAIVDGEVIFAILT